jgi:hypothetical protein
MDLFVNNFEKKKEMVEKRCKEAKRQRCKEK